MCFMVCLDNVPLSICLLPDCVTSLEKIHVLKCCIFGESHVTRFLVFVLSLHCAGKCMAKLYET